MIAAAVEVAVTEALARTRFRERSVFFDDQLIARAGRRVTDESQAMELSFAKALQSVYYGRLYTRGISSNGTFARRPPNGGGMSKAQFEHNLATMFRHRSIQEGWRIERVIEDRVEIIRKGIRLSAAPDDVIRVAGEQWASGDFVSFGIPGCLKNISPGFLMTFGPRNRESADSENTVRWYWNLTPQIAPLFLEMLWQEANEREVTIQAKVLEYPEDYCRCDAGVLYTRMSELPRVCDLISATHAKIVSGLNEAVPLFAKRLGAGLAVAENPTDGDSFGMNRCLVLAKAIIAQRVQQHRSLAKRRQIVFGELANLGLRAEAPHLVDSLEDVYSPPVDVCAVPASRPKRSSSREGAIGSIVDIIVNDALRYRGRTTWLTRAMAPGRKEAKTTGIDLYGGLPGIAWFLAEFAAAFGDENARVTAEGAFEQAFVLAADGRATNDGLYDGKTGLVVAALHCASLMRSDAIRIRAITMARELVAAESAGNTNPSTDLMNGLAGRLLGLLAIRRALPDLATSVGIDQAVNNLVASATAKGDQTFWTGLGGTSKALTGYSHGVSGIGLSLAIAAHELGNDSLSSLAAGAFRYEDSLYNANSSNWPDLRGKGRGHADAWCHGGPGILLARNLASPYLQSHQIDPIGILENAHRGLAGRMNRLADEPNSDWTLCHGVTGLCEILATLGGSGTAIADDLVSIGIQEYSGSWPTPGGSREPTLMCGLSGIGLHILRSMKSGIASPLAFAVKSSCT